MVIIYPTTIIHTHIIVDIMYNEINMEDLQDLSMVGIRGFGSDMWNAIHIGQYFKRVAMWGDVYSSAGCYKLCIKVEDDMYRELTFIGGVYMPIQIRGWEAL